MAAKPATVEDECTCPVCHNLFTNPVVLLCGHSFCVVCLKTWWNQSWNQTCPVCKEISPTSQPPRNLVLKNMADALRREKSQTTSEDFCRIHGEKLKLFCHDDQQPICVICRDSVKHKKHNCVPLDEAAEEYRVKLRVGLRHLITNLGSSLHEQNHCEGMSNHIQSQAQQTEQSIREEFQKIHQLLHEDEAERIDALRKEVELKDKVMNTRIEKWNSDVLTVTEKVQTIEKETKNEDLLLLQNLNSTLQSLEHTSPDDEDNIGALVDQAKHLGNLQLSIWEKVLQTIKHIPVILDPNTACTGLNVSPDLSRIRKSDKLQPFPDNPERLRSFNILGYEGFTSGFHSWDVEVGGYWAVGVAAKTSDQINKRIWGIYMCVCTGVLRELKEYNYVDEVYQNNFPQKIRVEFDYERGSLSFFDLVLKRHVHTIRDNFTERVFPYFRENVRIMYVGGAETTMTDTLTEC